MPTGKDEILKNKNDERAEEKRTKTTDIDKIFTRWCDFGNHTNIFDYRNEYSNNYCTQINSFDNINLDFDKIMNKPNVDDPMYRLTRMPKNKNVGRQLVNVGFDDTLEDSNNLNGINLFCSEELYSSSDPKVSFTELPKDPFKDSDGERDKDCISDEDLNSVTDVAVVKENERQNNMDVTIVSLSGIFQHCEYDECNLTASSCCEKCLCLLCIQHFACQTQVNACDKHYAYSTENTVSPNVNENIVITRSHCQYLHCTDEVFSTCGKCLCFLCYTHFSSEDTYNNCNEHNF